MSMLERKLVRDLRLVKGQVATIALVVASGIAAFCAALSTYDSLRQMQAGLMVPAVAVSDDTSAVGEFEAVTPRH